MSLIITGVIDGPLTGGIPKAIELTVLSDIADLSVYGLGSANNGGGTDGVEFTFPAVLASAGDVIYVATESTGFTAFFGFAPDYVSSAASINGDDAVELFESGVAIDVFGDIALSGTGQPWDYLDGWAYRNSGVTGPNATFTISEWSFSGTNALDNETTNASAAVPFPAGQFAGNLGPSGPVLVAAEDFDGGAVNLIAGFAPASDNLDGGAGDFFGVGSISAWPQASGVPFSLADDSVADVSGGGIAAGDTEGVYGQNADLDNDFFALSDSDEFGTGQIASWTFDILGYDELILSIAMGGISDGTSFGGFDGQTVSFTYAIDGGPAQTAFLLGSTTETGSFAYRAMDLGTVTADVGVLEVTGDNTVTKLLAEDSSAAGDTFLDKATADTGTLDTFQTALDGSGATLTLTMTADFPFEAMLFDDIRVTGTEAPVAGSIFSIAALDAEKFEGDAGMTPFTFTLTRTGDTSGAASVDFAVSGAADAADFGGMLPSGTVAFAAGETDKVLTLGVSGDLTEEMDEDFTVTLDNPVGGSVAAGAAQGRILNDEFQITLIHDIQGNTDTWIEQFGRSDATPFFGTTVAVTAIVVGDFQNGDADDSRNLGGFYLQEEDADADGDASTSEGIFAFEGSGGFLQDVNVGDRVTVIGTATEFFGETQIAVTDIVVEAMAEPLPTAAEITFPIAGVMENPDGQLIADLEAYEGMLVSVSQAMTVADLFDYGRFGEIGLYADGRLATFTQTNAPDAAGFQEYLENAVANTITLNDGLATQNPFTLPYPDGSYGTMDGLSSGDTVTGITGVVRYSRSSGGSGDENYRINPTELPDFTDSSPRQETPPDVGGSLKVASYNVLNYFNGDGLGGGFPTARGADTFEEFQRQQEKLVDAISAIDADVVGLIEVENDGYGPNSAIATLVDALNAEMGAGTYAYVDPGVPQLGSDAIAVGFIYKPGTVVLRGSAAILDNSVDPRFDSDNMRPTLAQTFEEIASGETFTAVVNHFKSKGSPVEGTPGDEDQGDGAGNANTTRTLAAEALSDWLASDPTGSGDSDFLVIGDLNSYKMEDPVQTLLAGADGVLGTGDDLTDLAQDYSYGFPADLGAAGQVQAFGSLDYALGSAGLALQVAGAAVWHINSDEPGSLIDYNLEFKPANPDIYAPDAFASSDHDPVIIGLDLAPATSFARIEFEDRRFGDLATYSLDGEEIATETLRFLQRGIEFELAGLRIEADDGIRLSPEFVTTVGHGLGVDSVFGDRPFRNEARALDDRETLTFALDPVSGLGDARDVAFEFRTVRGSGQIRLNLFDDGAFLETVLLDIVDGKLGYDPAGNVEFDQVDIGTTGSLEVTLGAVGFARVAEDSFDFA